LNKKGMLIYLSSRLEDGEWVDAELQDFQDEDERGEWAPAVVELDEHGREKGLISF
jgi:A1 cistron-splicing factor AAR2